MTKTLAVAAPEAVKLESCQACDNAELKPVIFLGFFPPVNTLPANGVVPAVERSYPARLVFCEECKLVQMDTIVNRNILFPPEYPFSSGTTRALRENFQELCGEIAGIVDGFSKEGLIVDVGSNDGTLLSVFQAQGYRVVGVEPTDMADVANARGVTTTKDFFGSEAVDTILKEHGQASLITATNVFAHVDDIGGVIDSIDRLLADDGSLVLEVHYLGSVIDKLEYDKIIHEHLRYYSLTSLSNLLRKHGFNIYFSKHIPTHGGSLRVYASRDGQPGSEVADILTQEESVGLCDYGTLSLYKQSVARSKLKLLSLFAQIEAESARIFGIGASSRACTLIQYLGLDETIIDCVLEIPGSYKIGKFMPGTMIPILDERLLFSEQPDYALLLSWHIKDELIPKLKQKGFEGKFIVPLPEPEII